MQLFHADSNQAISKDETNEISQISLSKNRSPSHIKIRNNNQREMVFQIKVTRFLHISSFFGLSKTVAYFEPIQ
jgi:hypothetical protein